MRRRLTDAQFEAIRTDTRDLAEIAAAYGITRKYAWGIRDGTYTRKTPVEPTPRPSLPDRFYRPFRDGTYA